MVWMCSVRQLPISQQFPVSHEIPPKAYELWTCLDHFSPEEKDLVLKSLHRISYKEYFVAKMFALFFEPKSVLTPKVHVILAMQTALCPEFTAGWMTRFFPRIRSVLISPFPT